MGTKPYSVTLDTEYVSKAKELIKKDGGKLSPILNNLLGEWLAEKEEGEDGKSI